MTCKTLLAALVAGLDEMMEDAVNFKYMPKVLTREQQAELLQLPQK